jgi:hypothetical protein
MLEELHNQFRVIRGRQVVVDAHVARFYGVSTKRLNEQVKRHVSRFPEDIAFRLTAAEAADLRRELGYSWRGSRHAPRVFTECGVFMAAYVLHTDKAAETSVSLVRAIVASGDDLNFGRDLASQLDDVERRLAGDPGFPSELWRFLLEGP